MIIPLEWLKEYIDTKKSPQEIADSFTSLGLMLEKPIKNDILELEHRMDRSDWLSIIGCARDLAAYEQIKLKLPEINTKEGKRGGGVKIKVECPDLCHRFNTRVFRGIKVKESPEWLKKRLTEYGMTPINNIVDITNYVMVEYGNPMHAQDLAKFDKQEIVIRRAKNGEEITTLDGTLVKLDNSMFVLAQNDKPIVIGGIVGGNKTAVDSSTTDIVLDAGNYNQASVRKTARKLKIQNETVLRYDKYLHPKLTEIALERATKLILELAGGEFYENEDYYPKPVGIKTMKLTMQRITALSGLVIDSKQVTETLERLGYTLIKEHTSAEQLQAIDVQVPYFRTDVEVEDDIVADILRIYGYHNIPSQLVSAVPPKEITPEIVKFEETLRDALVNLGLHEHITDPIVSKSDSIKNQVLLENSLSSEKNALRTNMYETLLPVVSVYKKHGFKEIGLFEVGKVYTCLGPKNRYESYKEVHNIEVIYENGLSVYEKAKKTKELLYGLFNILNIKETDYMIEKEGNEAVFLQDDTELARLRLNSFTIHTASLLKATKTGSRVVDEIKNKITEDISIITELDKPFGPIFRKIATFDKRIKSTTVVEEYIDKKDNKRSVLVRLEFLEEETPKEETIKIKTEITKKFA
ncbi:MAG: hypothetical protein ACD_22C00218G0003 [uncultured bacterium]|nr:MAG: hypothetical protein ACD_22C00218G0003 [uncultured bacterium]